jgi:hypothetical protein
MHHILTDNSLTIIRDGRPATLHRGEAGEEVWADAIQAIRDGNYEAILRYLDRGQQVHQYFEGQGIEVRNGVLYYGDQPLDNYPARKAVQFWREGLPHEALINFLGRLVNNPSFRAVQDLYSFLEHNRMPLTTDGCFLAYKKVRRVEVGSHPFTGSPEFELRDIHSGRFRNDIGDTVSMPRNQVDEDPYQTCSRGLHVCGYDYLPAFGSGRWDTAVAVKVDPEHVVAVPVDYNNAKMRVAEYTVVEELPDYYETGHIWDGLTVVDDFDEDFDEDEDYYEDDPYFVS